MRSAQTLRGLSGRLAHGGAELRARVALPAQARHFRCSLVVEMGRRAAKIANTKGKADMARAKLYGRVGKQIIAAVKKGGPSEASNAALANVLAMCKLNSIPRDLIDRNIKKASSADQSDYTELTYEVYGAGGVGMVVEILTDNLNRAAMLVRSAVTKAGGKMADPGSVLFNFKRVGICVLTGGDEDAVFAAATDAGADDVQPRPGGEPGWEVITPADAYGAVAAALREAGLPMDADLSGQRLAPLMRVEVSDDEAAETNDLIVEKLLELDDVDAVVSNQAEDAE